MSILAPASVLFAYRAGGPFHGATFTRTGSGLYYNRLGTVSVQADDDIPRSDWVDADGDGLIERPALLLEGSRTCENTDSTDFSTTSDWADPVGVTKSNVTSAISGETATQCVDDGSAPNGLTQGVGTLTGAPETFSAIVENVSAVNTSIGHRDTTANDWVILGTLTWSTMTMAQGGSGVGSNVSVGVEDLGVGPNGGRLARIWVTGTPDNSGNNRTMYMYATGGGPVAGTAIFHHAQLEEAPTPSSPIIATTVAATRNAETLYWYFPSKPKAMTVYVRFIERGTIAASNSLGILHIGSSSFSADPRLALLESAGVYRFAHDNGTTVATANAVSAPSYGDTVELVGVLDGSGDVTLIQSINGGAVESDVSATAPGFAGPWADTRLYLGARGSPSGFAGFRDALVLKGALSGSAASIMQQCRRTRTAHGTPEDG